MRLTKKGRFRGGGVSGVMVANVGTDVEATIDGTLTAFEASAYAALSFPATLSSEDRAVVHNAGGRRGACNGCCALLLILCPPLSTSLSATTTTINQQQQPTTTTI